MGSEKVSTPMFLCILSNFSSISFLIPESPSMRKGRGGGKKNGGKKREKKQKTDENSGHYVIASIVAQKLAESELFKD